MVVNFHGQLGLCDIPTHIFLFFLHGQIYSFILYCNISKMFYRHVTISDTGCHISSSICQNFIVFMTPKLLNGTREKASELGLCMQTFNKEKKPRVLSYLNITMYNMVFCRIFCLK